MNHLCLLPGVLFLSVLRKVLNLPPLLLLGRYPYLLESLPYTLEVVTHTKKPEVSKQSKLKKVNIIQWVRGVGLFSLYTQGIPWHIQQQN